MGHDFYMRKHPGVSFRIHMNRVLGCYFRSSMSVWRRPPEDLTEVRPALRIHRGNDSRMMLRGRACGLFSGLYR